MPDASFLTSSPNKRNQGSLVKWLIPAPLWLLQCQKARACSEKEYTQAHSQGADRGHRSHRKASQWPHLGNVQQKQSSPGL